MTFSRNFPSKHIKAKEETYFVEKLWECIGLPDKEFCFNFPDEYQTFLRADDDLVWAKGHTIRSGNRWNKGDFFSPRVWSGAPYNSKQIIIAPDIEIKKIWDVVISVKDKHVFLDDNCFYEERGYEEIIKKLAHNDGLSVADFKDWFKKPFKGQVICWDEKVNY